MNQTPSWYVIQSKAKKEQVAQEQLQNQGYSTYLPLLKSKKRVRGKWSLIIEPLFPRYLFVNMTKYQDDFGPIRSTVGVSTMVKFGGQPATISQTIIEEIKSRESSESGCIDFQQPVFKKGQSVEVVEGPLQGLSGIFSAAKGEDRVIILLNLMSEQTRVTMPTDYVNAR